MKITWNELDICKDLKIASSFWDRTIGLMFKDKMPNYDGLLIKKCNSIHMFFCRFAIDAVFLNEELEVIKVYRNLKPWRITSMVFGASQVLELYANTVPQELDKGEKLSLCTN